MNPTVSIIIPIYNAEATLHRCIDSVLTQKYTDFELILVDDGSTDSSPAICDSYAAADERIRVIHQENRGVSASRNLAIGLALGEFLQFVDSDDWITPKTTQLFVDAAVANHCDMVIADFYRVSGNRVSHKRDIEEEGVLTREEFADCMMERPADFYYGVLWNKLFRRDIVKKYALTMNPEINWCEDFLFNLEYILHSETFYVLPVPVYYYLKRKGSLASQGMSFRKTVQMKLNVFAYYNNFYKNVWSEEEYEKRRFQVYRFLIDAAQDGVVPPLLLPGSKKLGEEHSILSLEALEGEGELLGAYKNRKLLDYYLETVAEKNNLTLSDVQLLMNIDVLRNVEAPQGEVQKEEENPDAADGPCGIPESGEAPASGPVCYDYLITRRKLADFAGISSQALSSGLQQLGRKGLLVVLRPERTLSPEDWEEGEDLAGSAPETDRLSGSEKKSEKSHRKKESKKIRIRLLPAAQTVLDGIRDAQELCMQAKYAGFTEEEWMQYEQLQKKIDENIRNVLI